MDEESEDGGRRTKRRDVIILYLLQYGCGSEFLVVVYKYVGAGNPFTKDIARGIMLLRINNLAKGFSGIRLETLQTMVDMLNKGVTPIIPEKGSLGASGDLAPLSHMVLPMIGLGLAEYEGEVLPGAEAMARAGIPTIELSAKEGLALNNVHRL